MCNPNSQKFFVTGGGSEFSDRQKNLFAKLDAVEEANKDIINADKSHEEYTSTECQLTHVDFDSSKRMKRQKRAETKHFRGKESIFKRPEVPPPWQGRNIPDHKKNPHKWTKYSLGDVSQDDMSDKTNTSTALSFLNELRNRKRTIHSIATDPEAKSLGKVLLFNKPADILQQEQIPAPSAFVGSKQVMPEYVIGQGSKKCNKKVKNLQTKLKSHSKPAELKLLHLLEDEEDMNNQ